MGFDLGELVGTMRMDVSPLDAALSRAEASIGAFRSSGKADGDAAGRAIADGVSSGLDRIPAEAGRAAAGVASQLRAGLGAAEAAADDAGKSAGRKFADGISDEAKAAGTAAGLGAGAALAVGVVDNLNMESARAKLGAELGLSSSETAAAGKLAGDVFTDNFGESIEDVNSAVVAVAKNTGLSLASADFKPITEKVLTLRDTFDQDLGMTTAAVGQMIRTGLVKDGAEALDILTVGLQGPADKAGDLAETFNEYGTQFRKLGLTGAESMGLMQQAVQAGARDSDIAADALKEFSIRAIDGSDSTSKAFQSLGMNGQKMSRDIAAGGPAASAALGATLDKLRNVKDPAEKAAISVALFGTQSEDLGKALDGMDTSTAVSELGQVEGAADKVSSAVGGTAQANIETYRRKIISIGRGAIESSGPLAALAGGAAAVGPAVLGAIPSLMAWRAARSAATAATVAGTAAEAVATRGLIASTVASVASTVAASAVIVGKWVLMGAQSLLQAGRMAAAWFIALGPLGWATAAIIAIALIVWRNWDKIKAKTLAVWDWLTGKISDVVGRVSSTISGWDLPGKMSRVWNAAKDGAISRAMALVAWVRGLPGRIGSALASLGGTLLRIGTTGFRRLQDGGVNVVSGLLRWAGGIAGKVLGAMGNLGSKLYGAGVDLVQGMVNGVASATAGLVKRAADTARAAVNAVKGALGINSPSRVMMALFRWVPIGAAKGMEAETPTLVRAARAMAGSVALAGTPFGPQGGLGMRIGAGGLSARTATVPSDSSTPSTARAGATVTQKIYTNDPRAAARESARRLALAGV